MSDYKSETQIRCEKIKNRLLKDLPPFCTTFFIGKEARLSAQTAVSYAYEYHYFFSYLCKYNSYFKNKGMRNITIEDIGLLKTEDIEEYLHWLRFHEKEILNDEDAVAYRDNTNNVKRQVCRNRGLRSGAEDLEYQESLPSGTRQLLDLMETLQGSDNVHIFPEKLYDNEDNLRSPENRIYSPKELMEMDWLDACVHGKLPHYDELDVKTRTVLAINGLDNVKGLEK